MSEGNRREKKEIKLRKERKQGREEVNRERIRYETILFT